MIKEAHGAKLYIFNSSDLIKKTQGAFGEKTQNSRKNQKKLKAKSKKNLKNRQEPEPRALSCQKNLKNKPWLH